MGLILFVGTLLAPSSSSSSVKSTISCEFDADDDDGGGGGAGWGLGVIIAGVFLIIVVLFVNAVVVAVVVVVKQGINCCNDGPVVRIGVRKLLKGREAISVGPFEFGVECVPLTC